MKRNNWKVKDYGIRPAGSPDHCFYCGQEKGKQEHKPDCVIRSRTVVLEMTMRIVMSVPEAWTAEQINSHYNQGTWCSSNIASHLVRLEKKIHCFCNFTRFKFLREASIKDENQQMLFVTKLPS